MQNAGERHSSQAQRCPRETVCPEPCWATVPLLSFLMELQLRKQQNDLGLVRHFTYRSNICGQNLLSLGLPASGYTTRPISAAWGLARVTVLGIETGNKAKGSVMNPLPSV